MQTVIENDARVLFQGDSITDSGWKAEGPDGLGKGYAFIAASWFQAMYPEKNVTFLNRGLSGNRASDLEGRWQKDCLDLKPSWVSIMIGINDTWRRYDSNDSTTAESYEKSCRNILTAVKTKLHAKLILMEPFVLPVPEDRKQWRVDLDPRIHIVRRLAVEFNAILVPLDGIFAAAATRQPPAFWAADGVHPSRAGHALIAQSWLKAVKAL